MEDADAQAEDVSDGISIISDCESTGRLSPHPYLRDHLNDLNFSELPPLNPMLGSELRARVHRLDSLERDESAHATAAAATVATRSVMSNSDVSIVAGYRLPPLVHTGLTAVFYVGVTLALLAFVGRLRNPEWQVLGVGGGGAGVKSLAELEQRVRELELQNNLMRAEIDIMSKQLNYLNALAGQGQGQAQAHSNGGGGAGRKAKTFKAWPGNGNTVDAVDITKEDLKRPYKCPDGKFVEIAAMCMESNQLKLKKTKRTNEKEPHAESLVDEIGNVVADVLQQSPAFQQFEKVTERLGTPPQQQQQQEQPGQQPKGSAIHAHAGDAGEEGASDGPVPVPPYAKSHKHYDTSRERYHQHNKKRTDHSSSRDKSYEHGSKERYARKYAAAAAAADRSKEQRQKQRRTRDTDDSGSGEWHERLMQHREHTRQRNEQKRTQNWYIERADSREQKRSGETAGR